MKNKWIIMAGVRSRNGFDTTVQAVPITGMHLVNGGTPWNTAQITIGSNQIYGLE